MRIAIVIVALACAAPAAAQEADKDLNGFRFCMGDNSTVREQTGGGFELTTFMDVAGDMSGAVFAGGKPILAETESFRALINTGYKIMLDKDGNPAGRPKPFSLSVTGGRFNDGRPEPIESLSWKLVAGSGAVEIPQMPLSEVSYSVAVPAGSIRTAETESGDNEVIADASALGSFIRAVENGASKLLLLQNGEEIASIPFARPDIRSQAQAKVAWASAAAKAITARGMCS